jgi:thiamine-phosphate pyrophosphorylase
VTVLPLDELARITAAVSIPVVAIGGIGAGNMSLLAGRGADGAAVVSAIFSAKDITEATRTLRTLAEKTFR